LAFNGATIEGTELKLPPAKPPPSSGGINEGRIVVGRQSRNRRFSGRAAALTSPASGPRGRCDQAPSERQLMQKGPLSAFRAGPLGAEAGQPAEDALAESL